MSDQAPKLVATYQYTDEAGNVLFEKLKYVPGPNGKKKGFKSRHLQENGEYAWGIPAGVHHVLYNLPAVIEAKEICLPAGEKDADTLNRLGLVATTNCDGENQPWVDESGKLAPWALPLVGKDIIVFQDMDKTGEERVERVLAALQGRVNSLALVKPSKGKDVTEWLENGGTPEDINKAIEFAKLPENHPAKRYREVLRKKGEPWARESEKVVLGALIAGRMKLDDVSHLSAKDFFIEQHRLIFEAIREAQHEGLMDRSGVAGKLEAKEKLEEVGGLTYLIDLTEDLPQLIDLEAHIDKVIEKSSTRQLIKDLSDSIESLVVGDDTESVRERITRSAQNQTGVTSTALATDSTSDIIGPDIGLFIAPKKIGIMCKPIAPIFREFYGLQPGQLCIIGARASQGKSSLSALIGLYSAIDKHETEILSFEVSKAECLLKIACIAAKVPYLSVISGQLTERQMIRLHDILTKIRKLPLRIDDESNWGLPKIKNHLRRRRAMGKPVRLLIIDYLQLMVSGGGKVNMHQEIGAVTRGLKLTAKEFGCSIILLSQLGRTVEREQRKPMLSDLRESGNIEADADIVLLLWHDFDHDSPAHDERDAEIQIAKQRNGPTGTYPVKFCKPFTFFYCPSELTLDYHNLYL